MIIIKNRIIPQKGFRALAFWPIIFYRLRDDETTAHKPNQKTINHEKIHFAQQKELLILGFLLLYIIFHFIYGYHKNPFEIEAYKNDSNFDYLENRKIFSWLKYLKNE
jgi:hypothetical protein